VNTVTYKYVRGALFLIISTIGVIIAITAPFEGLSKTGHIILGTCMSALSILYLALLSLPFSVSIGLLADFKFLSKQKQFCKIKV